MKVKYLRKIMHVVYSKPLTDHLSLFTFNLRWLTTATTSEKSEIK